MRDDFAWMDSALCAEVGGDFFFPATGQSYAEARQICGACPVRRQCAAFADAGEGNAAHPFRHGYWADETPRERAGKTG